MTINGKKYHAEYFCKCELCDLRGADGECGMSDNMTCEAFDKAVGWCATYPWYDGVKDEFRKAMEDGQ